MPVNDSTLSSASGEKMPVQPKGNISRRSFMKLTGAATAATAISGRSKVLHALVAKAPAVKKAGASKHFSVCDMCFNKCGLIARVNESGIVEKLDPNPKFLKSRGMLCARGNAGTKQLYDPDRLKYPLLRKGRRFGRHLRTPIALRLARPRHGQTGPRSRGGRGRRADGSRKRQTGLAGYALREFRFVLRWRNQ